ncbi:GntR family transcriptional regulator [Mangrovicoccus algicola]|uniref:GntR family transcriptional regulator n=1 Tax=Mangrovicoccus algicola TaxID=2771008 RepID=A0A8J6YSB3_9RHOB|nr:GntR family transcriptional regulator [Mangrovicoccus algicola]MBE3636782.1 GntR family transcriptional regulator [Mangrovicoccus algicola]
MSLDPSFELSAPVGSQLILTLRRRIVTGELVPGTRLSEKEIAADYGLSRQPVREAFIKLSADRLVEVRPQRGTFVCRIKIEDVMTSRFVREAVEADIARLAATRADDAAIRLLRDMLDRQRASLGAGGPVFMQLDEQFHRALAETAGQAGAWLHLESIKMHMDRVRHLTAAELPVAPLVDQHAAIVEAVAARDPDRAEGAVRAHLRGVLEHLEAMKLSLPDYFI